MTPEDSSRRASRSSRHHSRLSRGKKALFGLVVCFAFFTSVELVLWAVGVETVLEREDPFRGFSGLVSVFEPKGDVYRTARIEGPRTFNQQTFRVQKPKNGLRAFVLGGSSSYGFPWGAEAAFATHLGKALAHSHPDRLVEVVNASAVSYAIPRIQILIREIVRYEPDLIVVYSGHNEFVERGHFEALREQSAGLNWVSYFLSHSRLYTLLFRAKNRVTEGKREGLEAVVRRDESRRFSEEEKAEVIRDFEVGLRDVVREARIAGSTVLLSTVPANVREWRPQASSWVRPLQGDQRVEWARSLETARSLLGAQRLDEAAESIARAVSLAPLHAETRYEAGRIHDARRDWDRAYEEYALACDLDASPVRRLSGMNQAIRRVARDQGTLLVDCERLFEGLSPHRLVGLNLIEDYVHPTKQGHEHIAWGIYVTLEREWDSPSPLSREQFDDLVETRASGVDARNASWFFNQGYLLENQGRLAEAEAKYREALALSPAHGAAMANLARLLLKRNELTEARELSEALIRFDSNNPRAHLTHGTILFRQGWAEEAMAAFRKALELAPALAPAHLNLGRALIGRESYEEGAKHLDRALSIDPSLVQASVSLGRIREIQGRLEEAEEIYREAVVSHPDSVSAYARLASLLLRRGQAQEAGSFLKTARALAENDLQMRVELAEVLSQAESFDSVVDLLDEVARADAKNPTVHSLLGYALLRLGRPVEALAHLESAAVRLPGSLEVALNLGVTQLQLQDATAAESTLRHAVRLDGESAKARSMLGIALAMQGKWDDAIREFRKAVEIDPAEPGARQRLEEALRRRERAQ